MGRPRRFEITDALDPFDPGGVGTRTLWLEQGQIDYLIGDKRDAMLVARFARLQLVKEVVCEPVVVFRGLEREDHESSCCYVGKPSRDCPRPGIDAPAPPGMVFLVFVTQTGKVFDWRWERQSADEPTFPEEWQSRFTEIIWPPEDSRPLASPSS
jgi:hypothetical protein